MKLSYLLCAAAAIAAVPAWIGDGGRAFSGIADSSADEAGYRRTFDVDPKNLGTVGQQSRLPPDAGAQDRPGGKDEAVVFSVLEETKRVDGVETRVVEERETEHGELVEISRNYFAIDRTTGDVYYFGEDVDDYKDGKMVGHDGAWLSGVNGANFGLIMPGKPARGDKSIWRWRLGPRSGSRSWTWAPGSRRHFGPSTTSCIPGKTTCWIWDSSHKWYAAGIGMVGDGDLRAVNIEQPRK